MTTVSKSKRLTEEKLKTLFGDTKKKHFIDASVYYEDPTGEEKHYYGRMYFSTMKSLYSINDKYEMQFDRIYNLDDKYEDLNSLLHLEWFFDIVKKHGVHVAEQCILIWKSGVEYNLEDACDYFELKFVGKKTDEEIGEFVANWHKQKDESFTINKGQFKELGCKEREDNMQLIGEYLYYK